MSKKGKSVKNRSKAHAVIKNKTHVRANVKASDLNLSDELIISFKEHPVWVNCINKNYFCNCYKNSDEALKVLVKIFSSIFPSIQNDYKQMLNSKNNCHYLSGENKQKALKVIKEIHRINIDDEANIFQISDGTSGIRVIGILVSYSVQVFYPMFIDPHHLIYESKKYNSKDYKHYSVKMQDFV